MRLPKSGLYAQQGAGFIVVMFYFVVAALVMFLGLKLVPVYIDYFTVKKIISSMAYSEEVKTGTVAEIRRSFDRRATIDYQKSVTADDLEITKEGNETVVTAAWQQKIPLFTGYTLVVDFSTSTTDK